MKWLLTALLLLLAACPSRGQDAPEKLLTPAEATLLAYADVTAHALTTDGAARTRYLWLGNLPEKERAKLVTVLTGHVNQLSTSSDLTPPRSIAGGRLLAVVLDDYGWRREVWDQFAESDPYFYATVVIEVIETVHWAGGPDPDYGGKPYDAGDYKVTRKKKTRALAPWLNARAAAGLALATGAKAPIVHASVFLDSTGAAGDGRKPSYYDLLGIDSEAGFQKLLGVDLKRDVAFSTDLLASVGVSGVTQEPRGVQRVEKIGGGYWRTFDVVRGEGKDDKNALRILGSDKAGKPALRFDASEQYGHLPNGLWAFGLFDGAGKRQDAAPDRVAVDSVPLTRNNHRIAVCVSCTRCHANGGLQDLDDWARNFPPELDLLAGDATGKKPVDYEDVKRLRAQYRRKLEPSIEQDRKRYAAVLLEATGMKPEEWAKEFPAAWQAAADPDVTLEWAARDLGETPGRIRAALDWQVRTRGAVDPVLAVWLLPAARQRPLTVTHWREAIPLLQQYLAEVPK